MFKLLKPTFLIVPVAWVVIWLLMLLNGMTAVLKSTGLTPSPSWAIFTVQAIFTVPFVTQLWRKVWVGPFAKWYPDLNGVWDVEIYSNYSRIEAMVDAAKGKGASIDVDMAPEAALPPLIIRRAEATITQTWLRIDLVLCPVNADGTLKESTTLMVEPFQQPDGQRGLGYIFEQENSGHGPHDDPMFKGAGWIVVDRKDPNVLTGRMWTDRRWRQGKNTAAEVRFVRRT